MRALVRCVRLMPLHLELAWLRWASREINPLHPDVSYIAHRMAVLEERLV